jgi:Uma2 family endonuclease
MPTTPAPVAAPRPSANGRGRRLAFRVPADAHTLTGFRAWARSDDFPEAGRITFIGGELFVDMSGDELETHSKIKGEITFTLLGLNRETQLGIYYPDGVQISNPAADLSAIPVAVFITWDSLECGRVRLVPREGAPGQFIELEGTPDLVVEVVSDSSVAKDTNRLRQAYHRAGITEYWLIDARGEVLDFQLLQHRQTGYANAPLRAGWRRSRVLGRGFRLERSRGRMNLWEYRLHVQPGP